MAARGTASSGNPWITRQVAGNFSNVLQHDYQLETEQVLRAGIKSEYQAAGLIQRCLYFGRPSHRPSSKPHMMWP